MGDDRRSDAGRLVLMVVIGSNFIGTFMSSAISLLIPSIGRAYDVSAADVGWSATVYMLALTASAVPFGKLADSIGRRTVFLWGVFGFFLSSLLLSVAPNYPLFLILRAFQGASGGLMFGTNNAILSEQYPPEERGRALGISISATYLGTALGPVVSGWFSEFLDWRGAFLFMAVLAGAVGVLALRRLPRDDGQGGRFSDAGGGILYAVSILVVMYGLSSLSDLPRGLAALAAGAACFVLFLLHERKRENPVLELRLFTGNPRFVVSGAATVASYGAVFAVTYVLSVYFQVIRGIRQATSGVFMLAYPAVIVALSSFAGRLSDRRSPFRVAGAGMLICAASLALLSAFSFTTPLALTVLELALTGAGFSFFSSPNTNAIMSSVDRKDFGVAASMLATYRSLGQALSVAAATSIVGGAAGGATLEEADPRALLAAMRGVLILFSVLCAAAGVVEIRADGSGGSKRCPGAA